MDIISLKSKFYIPKCPRSIHPYNMKNRNIYWRRYEIQERLYIGQCCLSSPRSRYFGTLQGSPSVSSTVQNTVQNSLLESPSVAPSYFLESHQQCKISSFSKVILVLGKARSPGHRVWLTGSSLNRVIASGSTMFLCSGSRSFSMNFATTHFTPRSCVKILTQ